MFDIMLIDELDESRKNKNNRVAVRGLVLREDKKILMLKSSLGDYRVPGGGVELGEKLEEALKRELQEELGCTNISITRYAGKTTRLKNDKKDSTATIEMVNHYFICTIEPVNGKLDEYKFSAETNMDVEWVSIIEALDNNKIIYDKNKENEPWMKNSFPIFNTIISECNELI